MGDIVNICGWNNQTLGRATHPSGFCPTAKCAFKQIISQHHAEKTFICVCVRERNHFRAH